MWPHTVSRMREFYRQQEPQLTLRAGVISISSRTGAGSDARPLERHAATARGVIV